MSDIVNELRQHALICANEIKKWNPDDSNKVERAYGLAEMFAGNHCPTCWVKDEKAMLLTVLTSNFLTFRTVTKYYRCGRCKFSCVFPKQQRTET
ncbi:hypothetical protein C8R32_10124 [Nitrosospira sp. Nsp5]|uniref:Uncharacterized protein n=1 Tax=Nitrosospira multiformis TaxID=1231 RepID=A0ABY0TH45_9PROT|nr:hypothetical protein C8R32_10124 [Nitrosospira sp. Nsp5]SDQ82422.1 hypothetical protein SAMN05216402_2439 [Nitrosospira multiformis]